MREPAAVERKRHGLPWGAVAMLLALCIAPVAAMVVITSMLGRDCRVLTSSEGEARPNLLWRIEVQRCGTGPQITNVLVAPRGKSFALAASARGVPTPVGVERSDDGRAWLVLDGRSSDGATERALPLKATGRPSQPLVLVDGAPIQ